MVPRAVLMKSYLGNPQMDLQDQRVIDSGCSRHMTGNMSYLTDYEEIDRGYVAFGGNPKGGKITRKARTPKQNGVAKRRNRTLIEVAETMLADSRLPTTFWAEAVNIACYVQNRVLVVKSHNKTPYELFHCKTPPLSFMRPFGYLLTILNTIDHLGKFDGKADEGTQSNGFVDIKASDNACQARMETEPVKNYILLPFWPADPPYSQDQIVHVDRIQTWYLILSLFEVPGLAKIHILVLVFEEVSTGSLSSSEADSYGGVIWLAISLPCILVGCKRYGCNEAFDVLHGVSLTPFGIVSESQRFMNRDRHCAYRPIESIGGRSLEPAAIMLLCI
ncbi:retrovirus-related pol polyprotein from transposon TNT 1-94 [Tanacetum coccineum]